MKVKYLFLFGLFILLSMPLLKAGEVLAQACGTVKVCTAKNTCTSIYGSAQPVLGAPPGNCPRCLVNSDCGGNDYFSPQVPGLPQTLYGIVKSCGKNVVPGSKVEVKVCNGPSFTSYFVGDCGTFAPGRTCYAVSVQGDIQCSLVKKGGTNGDPLNFYINGRPATVRGWWTRFISGVSTRWDIESCL